MLLENRAPHSGLRKPIDGPASVRWVVVNESRATWASGSREGGGAKSRDQASGRRLIPGGRGTTLLLLCTPAHGRQRRARQKHALSPSSSRDASLIRQRRLPQNKPCDANPEVASGSAWPNVGLTAAFAAPRPGGFSLCASGTPLPLGRPSSRAAPHTVAWCSSCVANRGKGSRATQRDDPPGKGLKLQPRRLAGLAGLGWLMGTRSRWRAGLGAMARSMGASTPDEARIRHRADQTGCEI